MSFRPDAPLLKRLCAMLAILLPAALLVGCATGQRRAAASPDSAPAGYLLIAGGGVRDNRPEVMRAFFAHVPPDGRVGVIPAATAMPEESGLAAVKSLSEYAGARIVELIDISLKSPQNADSPMVAKQIEECAAIWFTGGDQNRITALLRPRDANTGACHDTRAMLALRGLLRRGGTIGGTSAGAAMMSDPMICGGGSAAAIRDGWRDHPTPLLVDLIGEIAADEASATTRPSSAAAAEDDAPAAGVRIGPGLGFFPYGLTDQHFIRRGRFGRLIVALQATGQRLGFGVEEDSALCVDLAGGTARVVGAHGCVLIDMKHARQGEGVLENVRLSLLAHGDEVDGASGKIHRAPATAVDLPPSGRWRSLDKGPWDRAVLLEVLPLLSEYATVSTRDVNCTLNFIMDGESIPVRDASGALVAVQHVRVDIHRPAAAP